jgi:hypothetical protein
MPITRTPIVDDDGSGTTGTVIDNAWKQQLYDQIDALAGGAVTPWTPADKSGANLALTYANGLAVKIGRFVHVQFQVIYPANASGAVAVLGNLPYPARVIGSGGTPGYGSGATMWYIAVDSVLLQPLVLATGAQVTNTALAGINVIVSLDYVTD